MPEIKTILYVTDLGKRMRPVFRQAISLAQRYQAKVIMLHVLEPLGVTGEAVVSTYLPERELEQLERDGMQKILEQMKRRLRLFCEEEMETCADKPGTVSDILVTTGRPAEQIAEQAVSRNADIIVMGSCSDGILKNGLLGSTTRYVTQISHVPVLVVPNCKSS